jgi:hypothetical protein
LNGIDYLTYIGNSCNQCTSDVCQFANIVLVQFGLVEKQKFKFQIWIVVPYPPNSGVDLAKGKHDDVKVNSHLPRLQWRRERAQSFAETMLKEPSNKVEKAGHHEIQLNEGIIGTNSIPGCRQKLQVEHRPLQDALSLQARSRDSLGRALQRARAAP